MKLEQAAREVVRQHSMECLSDKTVDALREALAEQAEQEPVAWKDLTYGNLHHQDFGNSIPLYAAPVRTKDLTDDEIVDIWNRNCEMIDRCRAVIAADREKNK